ncbi:MAG: DUF2157 domain-containing protein [Rubrobacter sp.]|nr:DUF2157 domain-containing protein [Rubrobacter sp.]
MRVSRKDLDRAVSRRIISDGQAGEFWRMLEEERSGEARFDLPHVAYYFGAIIVVSAMTWFMTLGFERFGGVGITAISVAYAFVFAAFGAWMWGREELRVPGGLLVAAAVCMAPLAVYGIQEAFGVWPSENPGTYQSFYEWIPGGWFAMEVATIFAGAVAIYFVRFPFLVAPVAFTLWFMSMDVSPLIFGENFYEQSGPQWVSMGFGAAMLAGSFVVDRRTEEDYAFWGYLFGMFAFWGGLSLFEGGSEVEWAIYGAVNLGLMLLSVLLDRRVFLVFGAIGVFGYVGHLAWDLFENSMLFPFALSAVGLAVIALGILYARNREGIEGAVMSLVPDGARDFLPRERAGR